MSTPDRRLTNKTAIITGASSGIGRATALLFARHGCNLICSDIREDARPDRPEATPLTTVAECISLGARAIFVKADTSSAAEVEALIAAAVSGFGRLDIMVNNAGVAYDGADPQPIWEYPDEHWDHTIAVNLKGVFLGCKFAAKQMVGQEPGASGDRGWIVNMASVLGIGGTPNSASYVASKHGVLGLTKTVAWDCAPHRIHVNAVCPGYTATSMTAAFWDNKDVRARLDGMHPFRGLGTPEDIARAVLFLASEEASWITGVGLPVDGGYSSM
ncbi:putative short chain type dehydrogenase [Clohesyomyces aquaticus]|uniref:Putative short chain type dehydrogenase n=1 Tax=Clohesyomyces aquaticus TaxID=1231657 RepID=A0A1Y1YL58_9PLEO|nr:putative short chain type dehydrogenase [Clohesyomyces aquaticus]